MARFYASISGSAQNDATRQGTARSGIRGHIRGRNFGVRVVGFDGNNDEDTFSVYLTSGSNGHHCEKLIGRFTQADLEKEFVIVYPNEVEHETG